MIGSGNAFAGTTGQARADAEYGVLQLLLLSLSNQPRPERTTHDFEIATSNLIRGGMTLLSHEDAKSLR